MDRIGAVGPRTAARHSCAEDPFQAGWKESLQSELLNETLIKKSSVIDQDD